MSMPACTIAECGPSDLESLLEMMVDFNALEGIPWSRDACRPALERLLSSPDLGVAAHLLEDGARRGYCVLTWGYDLEWEGRDAFLTEFYLLPDARGRGLGGALLPLVEALARKYGARALHLMVRPENESAVRLYLGAGFETPPRLFLTKPLT
jgi:ribosomal protein S18 acetylase RimI-like enzyme